MSNIIQINDFSDFDTSLRINRDGNIRILRGEDVIKASIRNILSTKRGERVRRPQFGSNLWNFLWNPITEDNLLLIEQDVRRSLDENEDRIEVDSVNVRGDPTKNLIEIQVEYTVRETREPGSFSARVQSMVDQ